VQLKHRLWDHLRTAAYRLTAVHQDSHICNLQ
jgi:hypothetical protein